MTNLTHTLARKLEDTRWGTAVIAAFIAGAVFLILQMFLFGLASGASPMTAARMAAAIPLGRSALLEQGIGLEILLTALLTHFGLAILFAWILTPLIQNMNAASAIALGLAFGLLLYLIDFYVLTAAFPWFADARGWAMLISHMAFGGVLAWSYLHLRARVRRPVY